MASRITSTLFAIVAIAPATAVSVELEIRQQATVSEPQLEFSADRLSDPLWTEPFILPDGSVVTPQWVRQRCFGVARSPGERLTLFAASGRCERSAALAASRAMPADAWRLTLPVRGAAACICPNDPTNQPPMVSLDAGDGQQVVAGAAIQNVEFSAVDMEQLSLQPTFSFRLDDGAASAGLPAQLGQTCTAGSGTLACTVAGQVQTATGVLTLTLTVSDGFLQESADATITVVAPIDPIFADGFED